MRGILCGTSSQGRKQLSIKGTREIKEREAVDSKPALVCLKVSSTLLWAEC